MFWSVERGKDGGGREERGRQANGGKGSLNGKRVTSQAAKELTMEENNHKIK